MNDLRRAALQAVGKKLAEVLDELDSIENAEKDYRDSIPGSLRHSKRYERADAVCDALRDAVGYVDEAIMSVREAAK